MSRSTAYDRVWAKSARDGAGALTGWLPLSTHLADSAGVAELLWSDWLPPAVRDRVSGDLGGDDESARTLLAFLAGLHDLGKATPAFAVQATGPIAQLADDMRTAGLAIPSVLPPTERRQVRHELAGQVLLTEWLVARGWQRHVAQSYAVVLGGHHGAPPGFSALRRARPGPATAHLLGDGSWRDVREELVGEIVARTGAARWLDRWRDQPLSPPTQALLTGLVIVADWLASNPEYFPLADPGRQPEEDSETRVASGWKRVNLPKPWHAVDAGASATAMLHTRFGLPEGISARSLQEAVVDSARTMDLQGLLVVEGPMGGGKTEAGLSAAEILAARSGAAGVFVALPTQATADAMFARLQRWVISVPEGPHDDAPDDGVLSSRAVHLAHGKAWLNPSYATLPRWLPPMTVDIGRDQPVDERAPGARPAETWGAAYVDQWMTGRKKGVLADFVVGTVDQVLVAALQARHVALRHLALARKVVILDEVHACDVYMSEYLCRALEWLGAYGVPVVAMSATLPSALRAELVAAYQAGRDSTVWRPAAAGGLSERRRAPRTAAPAPAAASSSSSLLTFPVDGATTSRPVQADARRLEVAVSTAPDDLDTLVALLRADLGQGGCALVLRNTVSRAQATYDALSGELSGDLTLLHSRFTAADRKRIEDGLLAELGPPEASTRPARRIVVATQVVEQSLDVDFDLLVTDLAPMDLLLQRIGRLHRHARPPADRPEPLRHPRCVVVGVSDWRAEPPALDRGGVAVYGHHLLYRAAAQVLDLASSGVPILLPTDIAGFVEQSYSEAPLGPSSWHEAMQVARARAEHRDEGARAKASAFRLRPPGQEPTLIGWLDDSVGEAERDREGNAQVRDSEDSLEVLLVQAETPHRDAAWRLPDWLHGPMARRALPDNGLLDREEARALAGCAVRLPLQHTRGERGARLIGVLEEYYRDAWQRSPEIQGQLFLPLGDDRRARLRDLCDAVRRPRPPRDLLFGYDPVRGLTVEEIDD